MNHRTKVLVELYRRGDYSQLSFFEKQEQAMVALQNDLITELLYGGGARGGKSWFGNTWQLFNRLSMPESYGLIAREEYSKLKDTTLRTFFKVCSFYGLKKDVDYKANGIPTTIEFPNGSVIFFREIKYIPNDPEFDRLGSYDLTDSFLDEAQQIHWKARSVLRGRLSVLSGKGWKVKPKMFYSCNPSKNWVASEFVKPHESGTLPADMRFIKSLAPDNPHVGQDYIDNLMKADKVTRERLLYGNFDYDDDPSVLCDYDAICDLFTNTHVKDGEKRISADLAMQGRDRFISGLFSGLRVKIKINKPKSDGKSIETDLKTLKDKEGVGNSRIVADSDGLGAYLESYINNIVEFHGGSKAKDKQYFNLKSQCAFKLAELINAREIYIECTKEEEEIIKTEIATCLKRDKIDDDIIKYRLISKDKMKQSLGHSPDFLDMLIMGMYFEITKVNKIKARKR